MERKHVRLTIDITQSCFSVLGFSVSETVLKIINTREYQDTYCTSNICQTLTPLGPKKDVQIQLTPLPLQ